MRESLRIIARQLGLTVPFAALYAVTLAALIAAYIWGIQPLYGVAVVVAMLAGTVWRRETQCDTCHQSLEDTDPITRS